MLEDFGLGLSCECGKSVEVQDIYCSDCGAVLIHEPEKPEVAEKPVSQEVPKEKDFFDILP